MKTNMISFSVFYSAPLFVLAQSSGVYLSTSEFATCNLACEINSE